MVEKYKTHLYISKQFISTVLLYDLEIISLGSQLEGNCSQNQTRGENKWRRPN